jgi:ABC-type nitrate/sulfonate/bicarbonate transport system permease component
MSNRISASDIFYGLAGALAVLAVWEIAARGGFIDPAIFPSPTMAVYSASEKLRGPDVMAHIGWSMFRIIAGFTIGALAGVAIGIAAGWYKIANYLFLPLIELLRPIPPLAWIPLAIIWFGLGEPSKFFMIFLGAFFPVVTATYRGVTSVDPVLIRAAQSFGLKGIRLLVNVAIPGAAPDIATGIRIGWGLSFGVLVAAELIASDKGLGYMIMHARLLGYVDVIVVGIFLIGILNLLTDALIVWLIRKRIGRWHEV